MNHLRRFNESRFGTIFDYSPNIKAEDIIRFESQFEEDEDDINDILNIARDKGYYVNFNSEYINTSLVITIRNGIDRKLIQRRLGQMTTPDPTITGYKEFLDCVRNIKDRLSNLATVREECMPGHTILPNAPRNCRCVLLILRY